MSLKILFVEDLAADAELAAAELKRAGIELVARRVDTEGDFIRELNEFRPDIILSDFSMPRLAGYDALALAQAQGGAPDTPFIFLSGTIGEDNAIESLKRGATDYVLKDNLKRLAPGVRRAIEEARARTARQAAEDKLRDNEQRYRELFQSNPHSMWVYDTETLRFLAVNDAARSRYGFSH
jgi:CheY-like chemotaxis protein